MFQLAIQALAFCQSFLYCALATASKSSACLQQQSVRLQKFKNNQELGDASCPLQPRIHSDSMGNNQAKDQWLAWSPPGLVWTLDAFDFTIYCC